MKESLAFVFTLCSAYRKKNVLRYLRKYLKSRARYFAKKLLYLRILSESLEIFVGEKMRLLIFFIINFCWLNISHACDANSMVLYNKMFEMLQNDKTHYFVKQKILNDLEQRALAGDYGAFVVLANYVGDSSYFFVKKILDDSNTGNWQREKFLSYLDLLVVLGNGKAFAFVFDSHKWSVNPKTNELRINNQKVIKFLINLLVSELNDDVLVLIKTAIIIQGGIESFKQESRQLIEQDPARDIIRANLRQVEIKFITDSLYLK